MTTSVLAALPVPARLAGAFVLILLLPAGFLGLCALAMKRAASGARFAQLLPLLTLGLTFLLLVVFALRRSPETLAWCLAAAAALSVVPLALDQVVRRGAAGKQAPSPLPLPVRAAVVLFVPLFFLWLGFVEEIMHVTLPHVYIL